MSSAPTGIDVREYAYDLFSYIVPTGGEHLIDAGQRWMVTRIQIFAPDPLPAPGNGYIILGSAGGGQIFFQSGGCITLEPNGAFRDRLVIFGQGTQIIIESWFQANALAQGPGVVVTP
jgi:hypothetical protein